MSLRAVKQYCCLSLRFAFTVIVLPQPEGPRSRNGLPLHWLMAWRWLNLRIYHMRLARIDIKSCLVSPDCFQRGHKGQSIYNETGFGSGLDCVTPMLPLAASLEVEGKVEDGAFGGRHGVKFVVQRRRQRRGSRFTHQRVAHCSVKRRATATGAAATICRQHAAEGPSDGEEKGGLQPRAKILFLLQVGDRFIQSGGKKLQRLAVESRVGHLGHYVRGQRHTRPVNYCLTGRVHLEWRPPRANSGI